MVFFKNICLFIFVCVGSLLLQGLSLVAEAGTLSSCREEDTELSGDVPPGTEGLDEESAVLSTRAAVTTETYITSINSTLIEEDTDQLEFILMVLIPVILLSVLLLSAILVVIYHKRKRNKQEPSSQGSQSVLQTHELGSENVKVPIFEEDTPSVMEIEMEELDKWMNSMNRNGMDRTWSPALQADCLPTEPPRKPIHSLIFIKSIFGLRNDTPPFPFDN
ncbi:hypothetical protein FD755_018395 [Muntiacus reevesi]|uniref:Transmembrane protein 154 n=1 Tax=Muntiacus reevesi TaxID=9886 RepID=A0A5N3X8P7_MUNRE|nr:hypothetical protein FD755_018395 [Muntiacus reevesi]